MTIPQDLTEDGTAVLAVLAHCTVDGESRSTRWARGRSGLSGIEFSAAVVHLTDKKLVERDEERADQLLVTTAGWALVQEHKAYFRGIGKALTRCRNDVDREAASVRSSNTVRWTLVGAGVLLVLFTVGAAVAGWEISAAPRGHSKQRDRRSVTSDHHGPPGGPEVVIHGRSGGRGWPCRHRRYVCENEPRHPATEPQGHRDHAHCGSGRDPGTAARRHSTGCDRPSQRHRRIPIREGLVVR